MLESKYPINTTIGLEDFMLMPLSRTYWANINSTPLDAIWGSRKNKTTLPVKNTTVANPLVYVNEQLVLW